MDKEIIKKARQADLAQYLLSIGVPLVRNGSRYKHKEHDSLVFTENAYYWNSHQEHGNAIDYLVRHMNMNFVEAVTALVSINALEQAKPKEVDTIFKLDQAELCNDNDKIKTYLNKTRLIGYGVINYLIEKKLLFQEKQTNNAFFLIRDENNNCVGAEIQGTSKKRFKGVKANSKYGYGFNVKFTDVGEFDYALFFESAIDLMSFIDYKLNYENKSLKRCILISMSGLKINILKHSLKAFNGDMKVVLCVDNDKAGQAFKNEVEKADIKYITCMPDEKYKDWNEQLIDIKRNHKPIARLYKRGLENNKKLFEQAEGKIEISKTL